jgi:hypothetical protein
VKPLGVEDEMNCVIPDGVEGKLNALEVWGPDARAEP